MYAVIATGGKQERVAEGQRVEVELLGADEGAEVTLHARAAWSTATTVLATPAQLAGASRDRPRSSGAAKGPKINGFTYKRRTNQRRRYGHRQHYTTVEITGIAPRAEGGSRCRRPRAAAPPATAATPTPSASA